MKKLTISRSQIINTFIKKNNYKTYLEIGVNTPAQPGYNWDSVEVELKHGVDPAVDTTFRMTSDEFFAKHINMKYDIIFIDGLHIFEQVYKDIINSLKNLKEGGTIVIHDCNPIKEITQRRERASSVWHGDVWKAILKLRITNKNINILTIDADEGCAIIKKGSQKLLDIDNSEDIYNYNYFNKHRKEILNLISPNEFIKKMNSIIIVKLLGGLGNQLFQYAFGRHLALKNDCELKFDLSGYKNDKQRDYSLDNFNIKGKIATEDDIKPFSSDLKGLKHLLSRFGFKSNYILEKGLQFQEKYFNLSENKFVEGYWQSEKYFIGIKDIIKEDFKIVHEPDEQNKKLIDQIMNSNSISIHIRRGDYVKDLKTLKTHGACPISYYHEGVKILTKNIKDPSFFVFSDDPEWVKENLRLDFPTTYINHNGAGKDYEDLRLMSTCKHHIIANSSFSWWGAWLSDYDKQQVIAPKKWFNDPTKDFRDIVPQSWKKI